jgi:hypothetical protein
MKKHVHIPLKNGGHITWSENEPPSDEIMEAFEKLAERASTIAMNGKISCIGETSVIAIELAKTTEQQKAGQNLISCR